MILTYKYRLNETEKNRQLHRTIDLSGRAWNHCIALHRRYYPSSKTCHCCSYVSRSLSLSEREWNCPQCGEGLDRDGNAAMNIYQVGASTCGGGNRRPALALAFGVDPRTPRLWSREYVSFASMCLFYKGFQNNNTHTLNSSIYSSKA